MLNKNLTLILSSLILTAILTVGCVGIESPTVGNENKPSSETSNPDKDAPTAEQGLVTGLIVVRNMIDYVELPTGAVITVRLEDISLADAPSIVLSEQIYEDIPQLPLAYELGYDLDAIDETMVYAVSAKVTDAEGKLLFINDTIHSVLTRDAGNTTDIELIPIE